MGGKAIWDKVGLYVTLTAQQVRRMHTLALLPCTGEALFLHSCTPALHRWRPCTLLHSCVAHRVKRTEQHALLCYRLCWVDCWRLGCTTLFMHFFLRLRHCMLLCKYGSVPWFALCVFRCLQVDNGEPARMAEQLSRVRILNLDSVHVDKHPDCPLMDQPRVLRASLAILCAMPCEAKSVFLRDWASTPQVRDVRTHTYAGTPTPIHAHTHTHTQFNKSHTEGHRGTRMSCWSLSRKGSICEHTHTHTHTHTLTHTHTHRL